MRKISKLSLAALLAYAICCVEARADIGTLGDVTAENVFDPGPPEIPVNPDGYDATSNTGELIIGDTDVGGLTMDVGLQPAPLRSTTAIIGNEFLSVGRGEFVGIPSNWLIQTSLIIGNEGQGFLDLLNSAKVQVGSLLETNNQTIVTGSTGEVILGDLPDGDGHVTISGPASRIVTADLFVGDEGDGKIEIGTRGTMFTGNSILGNALGSYGKVALTDDGSVWKVGFDTEALDLTVGLLGRGILDISNEAKAEVSGDIAVGPLGIVNLKSGGRMRVLPTSVSAVAVVNDGNIRGGGFVDFAGSELINQGFGLIRNKVINTDTLTELADPQTLVFTGTLLTNNSTIFAEDGEMIFNVPVVNNAEFIVRDSFVQFPQGLDNSGGGTVVVGGDSTLHGAITPAPLSNFVVLSDSIVTIVGDLLFTEPFLLTDGDEDLVAASSGNEATLSIGLGTNPGFLTVTGDLDLTNAVLDLDFAGTSTPDIGDIVNLIQVGGNVTGTFQNSTVNVGGQVWEIDYSGGGIFATFTGIDSLPGDFDGDGDVDGRDFLVWQRNPSIGNLSDWQSGYGDGGSLGAVTASVPEPGTIVLLLGAALAVVNRRK